MNQVALSSEAGEAEIFIPRRLDGSLNHYEASLRPADEGNGDETGEVVQKVAVKTIDGFCEDSGIEQIDFIKCDVEGHELAVLAGGERILRACLPPILLEVNEPLDDGAHGSRVREKVESLGYAIHTYSKGEVSPWKPGERRVNYLLLSPGMAEKISRTTA